MNFYGKFVKRPLDIVCAVPVAVAALPFFLLTSAVLISCRRSFDIFFVQKRPGYKEKIFSIYKFKTMNDNRDAEGNLLPDCERLDKVGRIVRSLSLDELPQIWNVLKGDMSVIGPRPLLPQYLPLYSEEQRIRHDVLPGITGLAQVSGRNSISWTEKFRYDARYVREQSFTLDCRILLATVTKVLKRDGISQSGEATMEFFNGKN